MTNPEELKEQITALNPEALFADGLEDALVGHAVLGRVLPLYSVDKVIQILMDRDGMTEEEAEEFFEFNIVGAYMGPNTPLFHRFRWDPHENRSSLLVEDPGDSTVALEEIIDPEPVRVHADPGAHIDMLELIKEDAQRLVDNHSMLKKRAVKSSIYAWLIALIPLASTIYAFAYPSSSSFVKVSSISSLALCIPLAIGITYLNRKSTKRHRELVVMAERDRDQSEALIAKIHRQIAS